jgi:predicted Zn-dependent protease
MTRDQAQQLIERVVKMSKADSVEVGVSGGYSANVRFADNRISTAGGVSSAAVNITSAFGPKHAVTSTNDFTDEGLQQSVRQSEALAKLAPDDPESMPPLGAQQYEENIAYFDSTGNLGPDGRAEAARIAIDACKKAGDLKAAGFLVTGIGANAVGNSGGMFAYQSATTANYTLTVRTGDGTGSGWAGADHPDWSRLDVKAVADTAIQKALTSRNPVAVEPGRYTVILEPQAVGDLVQLLAFTFDARSADEGRSPYSKAGGGNKLGEKVADERVTLFSDPADPQLLTNTFDGSGLPAHRQVWIDKGILKRLTYSRFWAQKKGGTPDAGSNAVKLAGGTQSLDELIKSTPRGILVSRLWYLRPVDPRTVLYTGLTRDGTFLIENGKISKAAKNFRFNESPLFMLNNLDGLGPAVRVAGTESGGDVVMPALKVRDFNFTSLSDAV